jgi:hypothetical protein
VAASDKPRTMADTVKFNAGFATKFENRVKDKSLEQEVFGALRSYTDRLYWQRISKTAVGPRVHIKNNFKSDDQK